MTICVRNISFSYLGMPVLENVSFEIPRGEIWALLGRSGSGKSTLLNVVAGLYRPASGDVYIDGKMISRPGRIRGIMFQEEALLMWKSVKDNCMFAIPHGDTPMDQDTVFTLLEQVGLADYANRYPHSLSVGMRKRVEFVRAIVADNRYILADEPSVH
jgi:NitT/TauT family transport system ATP-binding protein